MWTNDTLLIYNDVCEWLDIPFYVSCTVIWHQAEFTQIYPSSPNIKHDCFFVYVDIFSVFTRRAHQSRWKAQSSRRKHIKSLQEEKLENHKRSGRISRLFSLCLAIPLCLVCFFWCFFSFSLNLIRPYLLSVYVSLPLSVLWSLLV